MLSQEKYPTIVKAIHQENGGHGEAVNTGIANASGVYFKVVDSDDWVDSDVLLKIIGILKELISGPDTVDMFISNYIYDKVGQKRKRIMQYRSAMPTDAYLPGKRWEACVSGITFSCILSFTGQVFCENVV